MYQGFCNTFLFLSSVLRYIIPDPESSYSFSFIDVFYVLAKVYDCMKCN
jgi:hypothetical protein